MNGAYNSKNSPNTPNHLIFLPYRQTYIQRICYYPKEIILPYTCIQWNCTPHAHQTSMATRVLIGLSLIPRLSGDRSSGAMHELIFEGLVGFESLLDEEVKCSCLQYPKPLRKSSIGVIIAYGCSSVTSEPHA